PGGACAGAGAVVPGVGNWWRPQQLRVRDYGAGPDVNLITFPAFEWHAGHDKSNDTSPIHRVVLFRDFDPFGKLPILPCDIMNLSPHCLLRFLKDSGFPPERAMVVPHMMWATDMNIDWDLTYTDSTVARGVDAEAYQRVGEIYSARANSQQVLQGKRGQPM